MNVYQRKIWLFLLTSILLVSAAFAEEKVVVQTTRSESVTDVVDNSNTQSRIWNLQDADILSVINEVSQETGKNFIVDPRISGKITLVSSKPLRKQEVYQVFLSVLGMLGYSAIPSGNVVKIVPNMESGELATKVATEGRPGRGDEVVVRVIPLRNVSATQLIQVLRPLLPQWSNISAYTPGNVLILLGRANNLERIMRVVYEVDRASSNGIQMIRLRHASAIQLSNVLNNLQNAARANGESAGVSIAVDERTNSILIGGPKAMRLRMSVLICQLDEPASNTGNTEVVYLRYLEAKTFAPILARIAQNINGKDSNASGQYDTSISITASATMSKASAKESVISSSNIQAEPSTNAIIITAPPALMIAIKSVIAKLDIRPASVLVEAIIAQIEESDLRSLGIQWGAVVTQGPSPLPQGASITDFAPFGAGIVGILHPRTPIRAVLSMLENMNGVDILSTPSIVVLDNQKAYIEVGQDVPYQTGSYTTPTATNTSQTLQPFNTFQSKPVTLRLDITPQINLCDSVRLHIKLKNDTLQNPQNPGNTPIINTNKIENTVLIRSEDVLVVGGLISNLNNENINKVPILGDVPLLGPLLFQQKTRTVTKKNLVVFIKPIIMHNSEDAMVISEAKYNTTRRAQVNYREDLQTVGRERAPTLLPPWDNTKDLPTPFEPCK